MKIFTINKHLKAECEYYETRYSWGHKGWLYRDNHEIGYQKITYYNRTWESYEFQSLLSNLADNKQLTPREAKLFKKKIENNWVKEDEKELNKRFKTIGMVAMMGDIFGQTPKESNDWKTRMIKAGLGEGIQVPDDWNELDEATKTIRLNAVIKNLSKE